VGQKDSEGSVIEEQWIRRAVAQKDGGKEGGREACELDGAASHNISGIGWPWGGRAVSQEGVGTRGQ
jgi:hypothetical protein